MLVLRFHNDSRYERLPSALRSLTSSFLALSDFLSLSQTSQSEHFVSLIPSSSPNFISIQAPESQLPSLLLRLRPRTLVLAVRTREDYRWTFRLLMSFQDAGKFRPFLQFFSEVRLLRACVCGLACDLFRHCQTYGTTVCSTRRLSIRTLVGFILEVENVEHPRTSFFPFRACKHGRVRN